ncbi:MAG: SusC/RagA family TonB-linked outer membrane protein [Prevotellaceae bacterium]|jgi:TonB-linked SusC/RagA family outer membrane protein|nr:SusC/RagA family TonB-linked outer membrane protein [Prevotellaceae bacterium]
MRQKLLKVINVNMLQRLAIMALVCGCSMSLFAQESRVTGKITDESGTALSGASILVKGTTNGVVTDARGDYSIMVSGNDATLEVSFLGYVTQDATVGGRSVINVSLAEDSQILDEVVVTALGITKEARKLGYAVSTIKSDEIVKVGAPNFATALYGKASGVRISSPPGGSASGVNINIRGISSLRENTQPMVFINGVPVRNGDNEDSYAKLGSQGLRSNGLVDINSEDIDNITILKGAAATALYGSEAANGVIMITSKKAKGRGVTVDANLTLAVNTLAYLPKIQNEFGPGSMTIQLDDYNLTHDRFATINYNGQDYTIPRWLSGITHVWGPKYDGREVLYWDGKTRPYKSLSDDPWKELFRTGSNQIYNIAVNQGNENSSNRFSYTYVNEVPNGLTGSFNKHNLNLVGNIKISNRVNVDYSGNYIIQKFHNRQNVVTGAYDSFDNMFSTFTDIPLMKQLYQTSLGYKNFHSGEVSATPNESFAMNVHQIDWVRDYLWRAYKNNGYETNSRFIGSVAPSWQITDFLTLRGRLSSDLSADNMEYKEATERPLALHDPSGSYRVTEKNYSIYHGDVMLILDKNIGENFNLGAALGWQGRQEKMVALSSFTDGGLTTENMFNLNASRYNVRTEMSKMELLKTAFMGSIDISYKNFLTLGITGRQEKTSTLAKGSNTYFYPSTSASFIYSDALKDVLPEWYSYGKLRLSYGIVGNAPAPYAANIVYDAQSQGGLSWTTMPGTMGNEELKPEKITEIEIGIENKLFNNRLGFEVSLYSRRISDMIIQQPVPASDGISNMWMNVGEMLNKGLEVSLNVTAVDTRNITWDVHTNLAFTSNKITKLAPGIDYMGNLGALGNTGGGLNLRSYVGRPMGDFYSSMPRTVTDPNSQYYGQPIVKIDGWESGAGGYYSTTTSEADHVNVGNVTPKIIGGLGTTFRYKNLYLDVMTDFRIGGHVMNSAEQFPTARGLTMKSLDYRDPAHGGLTYTFKGQTMTNGMIVPGVVEITDAAGNVTGYTPNTTVTPSDLYFATTYAWGTSSGRVFGFSVQENSYWKLRELALGYDMPGTWIEKISLQKLRVSVFGRNLGYFYKTLKYLDAESTNDGGTRWGSLAGVGYSAAPTRTFGLSLRATF